MKSKELVESLEKLKPFQEHEVMVRVEGTLIPAKDVCIIIDKDTKILNVVIRLGK